MTFLENAGVQTSVAMTYAAIFTKNNIAGDTLEDLDREDLVFMGISALGDIKRILKHAKKEMSMKYDNFGVGSGEDDEEANIGGWLKDEDGKEKTEVSGAYIDQGVVREDTGDPVDIVVGDSEKEENKMESETQEETLCQSANVKDNGTGASKAYGAIKVNEGMWVPVDAKSDLTFGDACEEISDDKKDIYDSYSDISGEDGTPSPKEEVDGTVKIGQERSEPKEESTCELCNKSFKSKNYNRPTIRVFIDSHVLCDDHKAKLESQFLSQANPVHEDKKAWRHGCKFACKFCSRRPSNKRAMMHHSTKEHGTDGGARHYHLIMVAEHQCLICKKYVVQDSAPLRDHLNSRHRMNLDFYEEKYYFPSLGYEPPKVAAGVSSNNRLVHKIPSNTKIFHGDKTAWRHGCKFACNFCPKKMSNKRAMRHHSQKEHGTNGMACNYQVSELAEHECLICRRPVVQDSVPLQHHMSKWHSMNLSTYEEKYYFPSLGSE